MGVRYRGCSFCLGFVFGFYGFIDLFKEVGDFGVDFVFFFACIFFFLVDDVSDEIGVFEAGDVGIFIVFLVGVFWV